MITIKQYFATLGLLIWVQLTLAQAPGNVSSNLEVWLKADAGVTSSGGSVSAWADQSGNGNDATAGDNPTIISDALNGNPVIEFDGVNDDLNGSSGFYTHDYFFVIDPNDSYSSTNSDDALLGMDGVDNYGVKFGSFTTHLTNEVLTHSVNDGSSNYYHAGVTGTGITFEDPMIINFRNNAAANDQELYLDDTFTPLTKANAFANLSNVSYKIGTNGEGEDNDTFDGRVAEVISYSSRLSDTDRRDVASYLAIKYGITLDITSQNYTLGGSPIYSYTSFANDIAGIGQDDSQGLNQASSQSINPDAIVTIQSASALSDGDFLVWGNDDGGTTSIATGITPYITERMIRVWGITETGDVGEVQVVMDLTGLGYGGKAAFEFTLIIDSDDDFTNGVLELVPGQTFATEMVTFADVDFTGASNFGLTTSVDFSLDTDGDEVPDYFEAWKGTIINDVDHPVIEGNLDDNLDAIPNLGMNDTGINGDGVSDALEKILVDNGATAPVSRITDTDGDGIPDYREVVDGSNPFNSEHPTAGGAADPDSDGIPVALEILIASEGGAADPELDTDTDSDGIPDYYEVLNFNDPNDANDPLVGGGSDSDGDGISNGMEQILTDGGAIGTIEVTTDTDDDGIPDYVEARTYTDPFNLANPFVPGTPDIRSLLTDFTATGGDCVNLSGFQWTHVYDDSGNVVFSINAVGNNLGNTCWGVRVLDSSDDDVRDDQYDYILDRNWYITPTSQPSSDVYIRFYALTDEHTDLGDELLADQSFVFDEEDHLRITKISGIADDLDPFVSGGTRLSLNPKVLDYSGNGKALVVGISTFSSFIPHVTPQNIEAVLPIELVNFEARKAGHNIALHWATATETNNDFFTIEKSNDGKKFESIGRVTGQGTSAKMVEYTYVDENPGFGVNYYRLKQTDFDGGYTYSEAVMAFSEGPDSFQMDVYPNPVAGQLNISFVSGGNSGKVNIRLMRLTGSVVGAWAVDQSNNAIRLELSHLIKGIYLLEVKMTDQTIMKRIYKY